MDAEYRLRLEKELLAMIEKQENKSLNDRLIMLRLKERVVMGNSREQDSNNDQKRIEAIQLIY